MHRRQFLAALPATLGLAGCLDSSETESDRTATATEPTATRTRTRTQTTDSTATPTGTPSPPPQTDGQVFTAIRYIRGPDAITIDGPSRAQFALIQTPFGIDDPPPSAFELQTADGSFSPASERPGISLELPGVWELYTDESRSGSLLFDLPVIETETPELVLDGTSYRLSAALTADLQATPEFTVTDVSGPSEVHPDGIVEIRVTVRNDGDRDGIFLGGIQQSGLPHTFETAVPVGERRTATARVEVYRDADSTVVLEVSWLGGTTVVEVPIRTESESATGTESTDAAK